jgi:hypothetical protein
MSTSPAGSNMTTGSNMTGPASNITGAAPTVNPGKQSLTQIILETRYCYYYYFIAVVGRATPMITVTNK